jgi:lipoprotein signal peptidase
LSIFPLKSHFQMLLSQMKYSAQIKNYLATAITTIIIKNNSHYFHFDFFFYQPPMQHLNYFLKIHHFLNTYLSYSLLKSHFLLLIHLHLHIHFLPLYFHSFPLSK